MTITAKIIADSISPTGKRITSLQLRYPRFIHAEFMTHRVFSRNASSSRAIPVERLIQDILDDTAMPIHWGKNQSGMQANEEHDELVWLPDPGMDTHLVKETFAASRENAWLWTRDQAIIAARAFNEAGYHKQIVNRVLEPFSNINVVCTATEWDNFFELRDHPDAQPEIMVLAQEMKKAMGESDPEELQPGEWHLPYVGTGNVLWDDPISLGNAIKISVARCARVSYLTHEGKAPDIESDLKLYDRLVGSKPQHMSPCEHQATPATVGNTNFKGWTQHRWFLEKGLAGTEVPIEDDPMCPLYTAGCPRSANPMGAKARYRYGQPVHLKDGEPK